MFPWCGLRFDTKTCEIMANYDRYSDDTLRLLFLLCRGIFVSFSQSVRTENIIVALLLVN